MFVFLHVILITLSNFLVQYPFELFGYQTTYGAFTYPAIFILSDLATRYYGKKAACKIIYQAMMPGLLISFLISFMAFKNISSLWLVGRISFACFVAYSLGQLLDIYIFSIVNKSNRWYLAPLISCSISNVVDTFTFFFLAFYHSSQKYFALYWFQIACSDLTFKCLISIIAFIPFYGLLINFKNLNYAKLSFSK